MLPRPPPDDYEQHNAWHSSHPAGGSNTSSASSNSTSAVPPVTAFPPPPHPESWAHSAPSYPPLADAVSYPLMHPIDLSGRPSGLNQYSPAPLPPPPLAPPAPQPLTYTGYPGASEGRPNGLTMYRTSELSPVPSIRAQWSTRDRRKSSKIEESGTPEDSIVHEHTGWGEQVLADSRRAAWASAILPPPFGGPGDGQPGDFPHFSHSPLTIDSNYISPLSVSPSSASQILPPIGARHAYDPSQQPQQSFFGSATSTSTSSPYAHHYPFQPPPPVAAAQDLSLPFRDFTGPQAQPAPFLPGLHHPQAQFHTHSMPSAHLSAAPIPPNGQVPTTSALASTDTARPQTSPRRRSSPTVQRSNPSSPYIPAADPSKPSAVVLKAAANREQLGTLDITGRLTAPEKQARRAMMQASTRRAVELEFNCAQCGGGIGKLTLRGGAVDMAGGNDATNYVGRFVCSTCLPLPTALANGKEREIAFAGYSDEAVYEDTLSAAVDRFQGLDLSRSDVRPPPAPPGKSRTGFTPTQAFMSGKKRRASVLDVTEGLLGCDVCRREIASGELCLATGDAVNASIEVLCAHCDGRYLRCSDCGGGGGTKGVGRWRCKEMFPHGRRTCQLVHTRLGLVNEMDYDVWPIAQLSETERDRVSTICAELHNSAILATLAVPDMIESVSAIARSFEEVEKACIDCWTYIALRWSTPTVRKKKSRAKNPVLNADGTPVRRATTKTKTRESASVSPDLDSQGPVLFREGKTLSGFIIAEHDLRDGVLHLALTVPTGAGEAYDATSRLLQTLIARAHNDLAAMNAERISRSLPPYPPLTQAWTMHMTKRDSRIMSRVETRRGFIPLEDFLTTHPDSRRECFAPLRECYLPPELLRGWVVYIKMISQEDFPPNYASQPQHYSHYDHVSYPPAFNM
ncbi:uncharacterized protein JCM15063_000254 [Sporobolomyces koalae]|uniref:uncharacterized protein n=1 Tax=Sporobolomyces koalae TaxID=500713 RepID=UPI00316D2B4F